MRGELIGRGERIDKRFVLVTREGAVEIRAFFTNAVHCFLPPARGAEGDGLVDRLDRHHGGDGVVEGQRLHTESRADGVGERIGGERTGRDDADIGERRHFLARHTDARVCMNTIVHMLRENLAVDRERRSARNARLIGALENERAELPHFGLQQAVRVAGLGALERVRADELTELLRSMRGGATHGTHLTDHDRVPALSELPRGFTAGEPAADHLHFVGCHACSLTARTFCGSVRGALAGWVGVHARAASGITPSPLAARAVGHGAELMDRGAHAEAAAGRPRAERATRGTWCACARRRRSARAAHAWPRWTRAIGDGERPQRASGSRWRP